METCSDSCAQSKLRSFHYILYARNSVEDRALSNAVRHLRGEREQMNMNNACIVKVNCAQVDCAARINTRRALPLLLERAMLLLQQEEITFNESVLYCIRIAYVPYMNSTVHSVYCTERRMFTD